MRLIYYTFFVLLFIGVAIQVTVAYQERMALLSDKFSLKIFKSELAPKIIFIKPIKEKEIEIKEVEVIPIIKAIEHKPIKKIIIVKIDTFIEPKKITPPAPQIPRIKVTKIK